MTNPAPGSAVWDILESHIIVLDINPEPWAVGTASAGRRDGHIKGSLSPNQKLVTYQKALREELESRGYHMADQMQRLNLQFYFWRQIDTWQTPTGRIRHGHVADATNLQKATEDALQGILFHNDSMVQSVSSVIVEQATDTRPAVHISIQPYWIESGFKNQLEAANEHLRTQAGQQHSLLGPVMDSVSLRVCSGDFVTNIEANAGKLQPTRFSVRIIETNTRMGWVRNISVTIDSPPLLLCLVGILLAKFPDLHLMQYIDDAPERTELEAHLKRVTDEV